MFLNYNFVIVDGKWKHVFNSVVYRTVDSKYFNLVTKKAIFSLIQDLDGLKTPKASK